MRKYEIMFITKNTADVESKVVAETQKLVLTDNGAKVIEFKELGDKKLAYPIKKETTGSYYLMIVEADNNAINEFDRKIKLDENVIRHLIIRKDEE